LKVTGRQRSEWSDTRNSDSEELNTVFFRQQKQTRRVTIAYSASMKIGLQPAIKKGQEWRRV